MNAASIPAHDAPWNEIAPRLPQMAAVAKAKGRKIAAYYARTVETPSDCPSAGMATEREYKIAKVRQFIAKGHYA
jgi:hypothetical protein